MVILTFNPLPFGKGEKREIPMASPKTHRFLAWVGPQPVTRLW